MEEPKGLNEAEKVALGVGVAGIVLILVGVIICMIFWQRKERKRKQKKQNMRVMPYPDGQPQVPAIPFAMPPPIAMVEPPVFAPQPVPVVQSLEGYSASVYSQPPETSFIPIQAPSPQFSRRSPVQFLPARQPSPVQFIGGPPSPIPIMAGRPASPTIQFVQAPASPVNYGGTMVAIQ